MSITYELKSICGTLFCILFLFLIVFITNNIITVSEIPAVESYEETINYCEIFNPDANQLTYEISREKSVREYNMKINKEMDVISRFIKKKNNRAPLIVADKIAHSVINQCVEHNIPEELVIGIMLPESFYDPYAVGPAVGSKRRRARGLGQILDDKCGDENIRKDKLHNIDYNISWIIKIIKSKLSATDGDLDKALYFYVGKDKDYAAKVFKTMGEFRYFRSQNL